MAAQTLAQAKLNTTSALDLAVIDEFRKFGGLLLDRMSFDPCVSPVGGGATLSYTYTRLVTESSAAFRRVNTEYSDDVATRVRKSVDLVPLGGAFQVDRVLASLGPAATGEVSFQMSQKIKSTVAKFADEFVNGVNGAADAFDTATPGFDGIDKAVTGTVTEKVAAKSWNWGSASTTNDYQDALDELDEWIDTFDALPDILLTNYKGASKIRSLARRAGYYDRNRNEFGQEVESYRGIGFMNLGEKPASSNPIVADTTTGTSPNASTVTSIYGIRFGLDAVHGVSTPGQLVKTWLPDFAHAGAVKKGEVEMGPVAVAVKRTRSVGAFRVEIKKA